MSGFPNPMELPDDELLINILELVERATLRHPNAEDILTIYILEAWRRGLLDGVTLE
jgi:hypothetical protein